MTKHPKGDRCPNCGYCPHCGRANPAPYIWPRPYPQGPYWIAPNHQYVYPKYTNITGAASNTAITSTAPINNVIG